MNILVLAPYAINTPHFETELEIIQKHLDSGDRVTVLGCNGNLVACDVNLSHHIHQCLNCISRRIEGLKFLSKPVETKSIYNLTPQNKEELKSLKTDFSKTSELKSFKIENFDIGFATLSSLISAIREPEPDIDQYRDVIVRLMQAALIVYRSVQNHLLAEKFDRVYVYNGRYASMRAAFRACQSQEIECLLHEKSRTLNHYGLWKNTLPHDISYAESLIKESWRESTGSLEAEKIAASFFLDRDKGISHTWFSFTKDQQDNLLPDNWKNSRINIAIFSSSEDEFTSIGDQWENPLYESQYEGLIKIIESIGEDDLIHLYLRVHPNLKNVKNKQINQINSLKFKNLTVIPPDSPVSSYTLLKNASKVVTFGSTMGIEAVYWGIPSILAGQSFYRNLGGTYNPKTHEELVEMLYSELLPKDKTAALMYGYYFSTWGIPFKYYEALGIYEGKFKGVKIQPKITVDLVVNQALEELNVNQHPEIALNLFDRAIAAQPKVPGLQYGKAVALARLERTEEAIKTLQTLLSVLPAHQKARGLLDELQPVPELVIDDAEFQELLPVIRSQTSLSDASLYSLFSRAKQVCEQNIPGNFIELGIDGGAAVLMAAVIKRHSKQQRWVYAFEGESYTTNSAGQVREICAKLGINDIVKPITGNIRETVPKMQYIVGVLALMHLNIEDDSIAKTLLDILYPHIANDALIQIDRGRDFGGSHRVLQELAAKRQIQFDLKAIDAMSVWFQKPDRHRVNSILNLELVKNFTEDDSTNYGIQSQMSINERFQLYYALRELLPRLPSPFRFVEIGSWAGGSLLLICKALKRMTPSVQGISIDPGGLPQLYQVLQYLQNDVRHLRMFSHQAIPHLKQFFDRDGNLPTFMFIDGDHTYEGVRRDIIDYFPLLAPGGLMVFHDYLPPLDLENQDSILFHHAGNEPGIRQACQEVMEATYGCEVLNIPLLYPTDPASTDASLPIIPGVSSTLRVYRKPL